MVFVEMDRNDKVFEKLDKILHDVENLLVNLLGELVPIMQMKILNYMKMHGKIL